MKVLLAVPLVVLAVAVTGCGGDHVVRDSASSPTSVPPTTRLTSTPTPTAAGPAAPVPTGRVSTAGLVTVMDTGTPELCLGPVAESYPPQCSGPRIGNWDWSRVQQGMYEHRGDVRWGQFGITGTFDGTTFTVTQAVPAPVFDAAYAPPTPTPAPATTYPQAGLEQIADELPDRMPGLLTAGASNDGHVVAEVVYDDGSLQTWCDQQYGAHVVVVTSALTVFSS